MNAALVSRRDSLKKHYKNLKPQISEQQRNVH